MRVIKTYQDNLVKDTATGITVEAKKHRENQQQLEQQIQILRQGSTHELEAAQESYLEIKEQLMEYKGLTQQLQDEKQSAIVQFTEEMDLKDSDMHTAN